MMVSNFDILADTAITQFAFFATYERLYLCVIFDPPVIAIDIFCGAPGKDIYTIYSILSEVEFTVTWFSSGTVFYFIGTNGSQSDIGLDLGIACRLFCY